MSTSEQMVRVVGEELGEMLDVSRVAAESYSDLAARVPGMTDDELVETIGYVSAVSERAWWLRGMCVLELRRRIDERAEQARLAGATTGLRVERGKALRQIAEQTGVSERHLREDAQIVEAIAPVISERMIVTEKISAAVMLPEGITRSVAEAIARERDTDRAYEVALDILHDKSIVPLQVFCQSLADRKKEEGADAEPPAAETPAQPPAPRPVVTRTEFVSGSISTEARGKLIKLQEKENLPTLALALERAIEIAWDVVSRRRSDARNAVK